ncbi:hypothetical protein ACH5RR_028631 [Cinchona calisaya]|uniref:SWIM-type domain-containing protein n=1 Tax=Cinchona calisaya TaxID=153742 RepID=A0ABD2YT98_9GENT
MKLHLAGERGSVAPCTKVAPKVRHAILGSLKEYLQKAKEKKGDFGEENSYGCSVNDFDGDDIQEIPPPRAKGVSINIVGVSAGKGKRKATTSINAYFKGGHDTSQPTIKACLQSKEKWHNTDMAVAIWFYDTFIPINAVNSPFYQRVIDHVASMRHGYKGLWDLLFDCCVYVMLMKSLQWGMFMKINRKRFYDPVDYESIDKIKFWIAEEEPVGKLDYEELEAEFEELHVDDDVGCSNSQQVEDQVTLDEVSNLIVSNSNKDVNIFHSFIPIDIIPKIGMEFKSEEAARLFYLAYAKETGFGIKKSRVHKDKNGNVIDRVFCYTTKGKRSKDKRDINVRVPRPETRFGCLARMVINRRQTGTFRITQLHIEHNHYLSSPNKTHLFRSHRDIVPVHAIEIDMARSVGIAPKVSYDLMVIQAGGQGNLGFTIQDYRNYFLSKRTRNMQVGDTGRVHEYLQRMQLEDLNFFFYAIQVDEDDLITNIFWTDAKMKADYTKFGDVCFDATYRKNNEGRPFALFAGVNHHKTTIFGAALLYDETALTFERLFDIFSRAMSGKKPNTILTDQDVAMAKALTSTWHDTRHRLCIWHIFQNAANHLSSVFAKYKSFANDFSSCVYDFDEEDDFIRKWKEMLDKYDLQDNDWLKRMFDIKEKWALVYGRGTFCADMTTTQRSESMNSGIEGYQSASVYTPEVFKWFQSEWFKSHDCALITCGEVGPVTEYQITPPGKSYRYIVRFDSANDEVSCSCKKYEFARMLCCHSMKALHVGNIIKIPDHYILKRWTIKAKVGYASDHDHYNINKELDEKVFLSVRYRDLCRLYTQLITRAVESEETYKFAKDGLLKMLEVVDAKLQHEKLNFEFPSPKTNDSNLKKAMSNASGIKFKGIKRKIKTRSGKRLKSALKKACKRKRATNKSSSSNNANLMPSLHLHDQQPIKDTFHVVSGNSTVLVPGLYQPQIMAEAVLGVVSGVVNVILEKTLAFAANEISRAWVVEKDLQKLAEKFCCPKMAIKIKNVTSSLEEAFQEANQIGLHAVEVIITAPDHKEDRLTTDPFVDESEIVGREVDVSKVNVEQIPSNVRTLYLVVEDYTVLKDFLKRFRYLSVLIVACEGATDLPNAVGEMKHLRYLDISKTKITTLPDSITKLYYLMSLRVNYGLQKIPNGFVNLINFRHFCPTDYFENEHIFLLPGIGQLSNLQRWPLFVVSQDKGCQIEELGCLHNLKGEIRICALENVSSSESAGKANLFGKSNIQSLELAWDRKREEDGEDNIDVMEGFQPHSNLKGLTIKGFKSSKFPSWMVGLQNLIKIELTALDKCEQVPSLGHLPCLQILEMSKLGNVNHIGSKFYGREYLDSARSGSSCSSEGAAITLFPALRTLKLRNMDNLVEWSDAAMISSDSSIKVFPNIQDLHLLVLPKLAILPDMYSLTCLQRLEIRSCESLSCLRNLNSLTSLESLSITSCPNLDATLNMDNPQPIRDLELSGCDKLISSLCSLDNFTSLVRLQIQSDPGFWPKDLQHLPNLRNLILGGVVNGHYDFDYFPASQGSKILATTRSHVVASVMQTSSSHELGLLLNDHSWMLFEKLAFADGGARKTPELEDIGRRILKRYGGVPLAIKAIGEKDQHNNIVSCKMHDLVHDFSLKVANNSFFDTNDGLGIKDDAEVVHLNLILREGKMLKNVKRIPPKLRTLYLEVENYVGLEDFLKRFKYLCVLKVACQSAKHLSDAVVQLSNLQRWPLFVVSQDKGCQIEELGRLHNLKGEIRICGLENVSSSESAAKANLFGKSNIQSLELAWDRKREEDGEDNIDVMEGLQPHSNLKGLTIKGFKSSKFPSWMVGLQNLIKIELTALDKCEQVPSLGHLPCLQILEMSRLGNVKRIGSEIYILKAYASLKLHAGIGLFALLCHVIALLGDKLNTDLEGPAQQEVCTFCYLHVVL